MNSSTTRAKSEPVTTDAQPPSVSSKATRRSARSRLLDAAATLFYADGMTATGIDKITAEAGVARKSLYNNFASKDELIRAYIERRHEEWLELYRARLARAGARDGSDGSLAASDARAASKAAVPPASITETVTTERTVTLPGGRGGVAIGRDGSVAVNAGASGGKSGVFAVFDAYLDHARAAYPHGFRGCGLLNAAAELPAGTPGREAVRRHKEEVESLLLGHLEQAGAPDPYSMAEHFSFLLEGAMSRAGLEGQPDRILRARKIAETLMESFPEEIS